MSSISKIFWLILFTKSCPCLNIYHYSNWNSIVRKYVRLGVHFLLKPLLYSGFPSWIQLVGVILGKMAKNCMKITKSTFLGQSNEGTWRDKSIFWVMGGISPFPPRETLLLCTAVTNSPFPRLPLISLFCFVPFVK